jgi:hypothetical protein
MMSSLEPQTGVVGVKLEMGICKDKKTYMLIVHPLCKTLVIALYARM